MIIDFKLISCYNVFNYFDFAIIYTIFVGGVFMSNITVLDVQEVFDKIKTDNSTKPENTEANNCCDNTMMSYDEFCNKYSIYQR